MAENVHLFIKFLHNKAGILQLQHILGVPFPIQLLQVTMDIMI